MKNIFKTIDKLVILSIMMSLILTVVHVSAVPENQISSNVKIIKLDDNQVTRMVKNSYNLDKYDEYVKLNNNVQSYDGNIPIISTDYDCQNPSISSNGNNILVIAEESSNLLNSDVVITYSSDSGESWSDIFGWTSDDSFEEKPVIEEITFSKTRQFKHKSILRKLALETE